MGPRIAAFVDVHATHFKILKLIFQEDEPIFHVNYWMNNTLAIMRNIDPEKPIFITEFGYNANLLNGREFVGTWDDCYDSLYTVN